MKCAKDLLPLNVLYWLSMFIHHIRHHIIIKLQTLQLSDEVLGVTLMTERMTSDTNPV